MAQGLNRGKGPRGGSEKFIISFNNVVDAFVDYINDDFSEDELNTISYYYYSLLPADFVARALAEAKKQAGKVSDSRRIKDGAINFDVIYAMSDDEFADFVDEIYTILEWYYGEEMPLTLEPLWETMSPTPDAVIMALRRLGHDKLDEILRAYGANNNYSDVIDELVP